MIYLDYQATTPVDPRVAEAVFQAMTTEFGNASSTDHTVGDRAAAAVKQAAHHVADLIGASPRQVIFTSGATESLNLAIQGTLNALPPKPHYKPRIAVSSVEHKAVLDPCATLQQQGHIDLVQIPVDTQARLDLECLEQACQEGLDLLCIMAANNEVGTLYPIETIAAIAQRHQIPLLCDASQAVGKIPLQFNSWGITLLALSAHKFYGPQGVGALVIQRSHPLTPLLYGGGQQRSLRPGTLNLPGIVGLGEACRLRMLEMATDEQRIQAQRDRLQAHLQATIPGLEINGDPDHRLAGTLSIAIPDLPNSAILARIRHQIALSTGSACTSGVEAPSHVLRAMNLPTPTQEGTLRISLGKFSIDPELDQAATILSQAVAAVRRCGGGL